MEDFFASICLYNLDLQVILYLSFTKSAISFLHNN